MADPHRTNNTPKGYRNFSLPRALTRRPTYEQTSNDNMSSAIERRRRAKLSVVMEDPGPRVDAGMYRAHFTSPSAATLPLHHNPPSLRPGHSMSSLRTTASTQSTSASVFSSSGKSWAIGLKPVKVAPPTLSAPRRLPLDTLCRLPPMEPQRPKPEPRDARLPKENDMYEIGQMLNKLDDNPKSSMEWDSDEDTPKGRGLLRKHKRKDEDAAGGSHFASSTHTSPLVTPSPPQGSFASPVDSAKSFTPSPSLPSTRKASKATFSPFPSPQIGDKREPLLETLLDKNGSVESLGLSLKLKNSVKLLLRGNANAAKHDKSSTPASSPATKSSPTTTASPIIKTSPIIKKSPYEPPTSSKLRYASNFDGADDSKANTTPWALPYPGDLWSTARKEAEARAFIEQTPPPPIPPSPARSAGRVLRSVKSDSSIRSTASGRELAPEIAPPTHVTKVEIINPDSSPLSYISRPAKPEKKQVARPAAPDLADDPEWDAAVARVKARVAETRAEEDRKAREALKLRQCTPKQKAEAEAKARVKHAERLIAHSSHAGYALKKAYSDMTTYELELIGSLFEEDLAEGMDWVPRVKNIFKKTTVQQAKNDIAMRAHVQRHKHILDLALQAKKKGEYDARRQAELDQIGNRMSRQIDKAMVDLDNGQADKAAARISQHIPTPAEDKIHVTEEGEAHASTENEVSASTKNVVLASTHDEDLASTQGEDLASTQNELRSSTEGEIHTFSGDEVHVANDDKVPAQGGTASARQSWCEYFGRTTDDDDTDYGSTNAERERTYQALCAPTSDDSSDNYGSTNAERDKTYQALCAPTSDDSPDKPVGLGIFDTDGNSIGGRAGATNRLGMRSKDIRYARTSSEVEAFMEEITRKKTPPVYTATPDSSSSAYSATPDGTPLLSDGSPYQAARDRGSVLHLEKPAIDRKNSAFMRIINEKAKEREQKLKAAHPAMRAHDDASSASPLVEQFRGDTNASYQTQDHGVSDWRGLDSGLGDTFPSTAGGLLDRRVRRKEPARLFVPPTPAALPSKRTGLDSHVSSPSADYGVGDRQGLDSGLGDTFPSPNDNFPEQRGRNQDAKPYNRSWFDWDNGADEGYGTAPIPQREIYYKGERERTDSPYPLPGSVKVKKMAQGWNKRNKSRIDELLESSGPTPRGSFIGAEEIERFNNPDYDPAPRAEPLANDSDDDEVEEITSPSAWKPGTNINISVEDVLAVWQDSPPSEHREHSTATKPAMEQTRPVNSEDFGSGPTKPSLRKSLGLNELRTHQEAKTFQHPEHDFAFETEKVMCHGKHTPTNDLPRAAAVPNLRSGMKARDLPVAPFTMHLHRHGINAQKLEQCKRCAKMCCLFADNVLLSGLPATNLTQQKIQKGAEEKVEMLRVMFPHGVDMFNTFLTCEECSDMVCPKCAVLCDEYLCRQPMCKECAGRKGGRCGIH